MRNAVLHLLTNRADTFGHTIFPSNDIYTAHTEEQVESDLRDFLKLRSGDDTYYLVGLLAAVDTFPEILSEFNETSRTYQLQDYRASAYSVYNGSLETGLDKNAEIDVIPTEFPPPFNTTITYQDSSVLKAVHGTVTALLPYRLRTGDLLDVDWPEDWGIKGLLGTNGAPWSTGANMRINYVPSAYPYKQVAEAVITNPPFLNLITTRGFLKFFHSAQSSIEKVALIALTLAHPAVYGS